jgi:hypothetical protein
MPERGPARELEPFNGRDMGPRQARARSLGSTFVGGSCLAPARSSIRQTLGQRPRVSDRAHCHWTTLRLRKGEGAGAGRSKMGADSRFRL